MSASNDCIFCKIANGTIPAPKVFEDSDFFCIRDIQPKAKIHLLVIPKAHVVSLEEVYSNGVQDQSATRAMVGGLFEAGVKVAKSQGLLPGGFRSIINTGKAAGQTVFHLHLHLLGGEPLADF